MFTQLYRQSVSCILSSILLGNMLYADGIVVDTAAAQKYQATMDITANHIPLINIVKPNSTGLSHNKFKEFNVESQGIILNNATGAVSTQLGGWVQGNANLGATPARVILNEVTGTNRSLLYGYTEVAGHSADVIVANPNGITMNGGGFINTSRATLTTGTAVLNGETLEGFHVQRGDILIDGEGMNADNIDRVELYTKALMLNAALYTKKLDVVTGENTITRDGAVTSDGVIGSEEFSIDSSLLGGIYGSTIRLVATDKGVGVNLPPITYAGDSLDLSADGKIVLETAIAENTLSVQSHSNSIMLKKQVWSDQASFIAQTTIDNEADTSVTTSALFTANTVNNHIGASIEADSIKMSVNETLINEGSLMGRALDLSAKKAINSDLIQGVSVKINVKDVLKNSGILSGNSGISLASESIINTSSGILTGENLILSGSSGSNSITNQGRIIGKEVAITAKDLSNADSITAETMDFTLTNTLKNDGIISVLENLDIAAPIITNNSSALMEANEMQLYASTSLENNGAISASHLSLTTPDILNNSTVIADHLTITGGTIINDGLFSSQYDMALFAKDLTNTGGIASINALGLPSLMSIEVDNLYNHNTIYSGGSINLYVKDTLLNQTNHSDATIYAYNDISIQGNHDKTFRTAHVINDKGTIETVVGDISIYANGFQNITDPVIKENSLVSTSTITLYPSGNSKFYDSLTITSGLKGAQTKHYSLSYLPQAQEEVRNDMIQAGEIKTYTGEKDTNGGFTINGVSYGLSEIVSITELPRESNPINMIQTKVKYNVTYIDKNDMTPDKILAKLNDYYGQYGLTVGYTTSIFSLPSLVFASYYIELPHKNEEKQRYYKTTINEESFISVPTRSAKIIAGGDITIDADTRNYLSLISAAGNINFKGSINNQGETLNRFRSTTGEYYYCYQDCDSFWHDPDYTWAPLEATYSSEIIGNLFSTIQAGGSISGDITSLTNDGGVSQNGTFSTYTPITTFNDTSVLISSTAYTSSNVNITPPTNPYSLFITADSTHPYLIESNPIYTDYNAFISSDYIMSRLNLDTAANTKRLGDARYETQLVMDAIVRLTGERYLAGFGSDRTQYQALMDNALAVSSDLNLEFGVSLSASQVAALNRDIVWMEEREVSGQKVLVPVVYLASLTTAKLSGGGKIIAGDGINLAVSGDVSNSGMIHGGTQLAIDADTLTNSSGILSSDGTTLLSATGDIINKNGGHISGKEVGILSSEGSVINETFTKTTTEGFANRDITYTLVGEKSTIQATDGNLIVQTKNDIKNIGADMSARQSIALISQEGDIDFKTKTIESGHNEIRGGSFDKAKDNGHLSSSADAGEDVIMQSEGNLNLEASKLSAGGTVVLDAGENVNFTALNDVHYSDLQATKKGSFGSSKTTRNMTYKESVIESKIDAADIVINSGKDVTLQAADLQAADTISVNAAGDINVLAKEYREGELHSVKKSSFGGLIGSSTLDSKDALKLHEATLKTEAKNIIMNSGQDINVIASNVSAGDALGIKATQNINILSDEEQNTQQHYSKKSGLSLGFSDGMLTVAEEKQIKDAKANITQKSSTLNGNTIVIEAGQDVTAIGSNGIASTIDVNAQRDVNILSATESAGHDHKESTAKAGIGVTLNMNEASLFAGVITKSDKLGEGQTREVDSQMLGDNITVHSGNNTNVLASNIIATNDVLIQADKNIHILSQDATAYKNQVHEELKTGIKVGVEQHVTDAAKQLADTAQSLPDSDNAVSAGSKVLKSVDLVTNTLSHSVSIGFDAVAEMSKSETSTQSISAQSSTIAAGHNMTLDAGKEVTVSGSDVMAGNKVSMNAENIILKSSVQNASSSSSDQSGSLKVTLFGTREGQVDASYAQSKNRSNDTTQRDTYIIGNDVTLNTSGDITLQGAHVSADTVSANIGGNLNLISVQDTGSSKGDSESISLSTGGSGSVSAGKSSSSKAWVEEQTGIIATKQVDITVGGNTDLQGAIIATKDTNGNDANNVHLATGTLSTSDISDHDTSTSMNIAIGNISASQFKSDSKGTTGATLEAGYANSDKEQINHATIGGGTIALADQETLPTTLNRDITKAQEITKDESANYDIYASQNSVNSVLNPTQTAENWKQAAKDMGLSVYKEITENLPNGDSGGLAGVVGKGLDAAEGIGLLPSQGNGGGYITQIATQLFGDNRTGIIVENKETLLKAGVSKDDIQEVILIKTEKGVKKAEDFKDTDIVLDTVTLYRTDPNKTVIIGDLNNKTGEPSLENYKIRLSAEDVKSSGIDHLFTNGMFNSIDTAAYNQQTQQGRADGILNYNQQHGIIGDLLESAQDALAVNTGLSALGTGGARQTGEVIDQMVTITNGNLSVGAHSQGTLMSQVGMEQNKEHLQELVQGNKDSNFLVGYAGSPVNHTIGETLLSEIYGGKEGIKSHIKDGTIGDVFRSNVSPQDAVGSFLGWQSAGINNSENLGNNVWESFLAIPRLFGIGGDSSHSYYPCVIGCGNENYTPDIKNYYTPDAKDGVKEHSRVEYYQGNFTNKDGKMTINMDLLPQTNKSDSIQQSTQTVLDTTKGQ